MTKKKYKTSYGIAICRYNPTKNNRIEILFGRKRNTYSLIEFINGNYNTEEKLLNLFNNMTFDEKVDILSGNFPNLWYKIWLENPDNCNTIKGNSFDLENYEHHRQYIRKKNKYHNEFRKENGEYFKRLINNSKNKELLWEIPKGGKEANETPIDCALRELEEETGISRDKINICWNITPQKFSYSEYNVEYNYVYYFAFFKPEWQIDNLVFNDYVRFFEINKIKWLGKSDLNILENERFTILFNQIVNRLKKNKFYKLQNNY